MALRTALWFGPGVALLAWAVNFSVMYALATYWCGRPVLGWIATLGSAAIALAVLLRALRSTEASSDGDSQLETRRLGRDVAIITALLALVAILLHGVAVLSLPACWPTSGSGLTIQHARAEPLDFAAGEGAADGHDVLAPIAAGRDVIEPARKLDAKRPRHVLTLAPERSRIQDVRGEIRSASEPM
jgi:hypothetical protein